MTVKINIKGDVVDDDTAFFYDYFQIGCINPSKVSSALNTADEDEDVELDIASYGGNVWAASEIYTILKNHKGKITAVVSGLAASAASVILMAADTRKISPTGQIMIHNAWTQVSGNQEDLAEVQQMLSSSDESIINAYELATGLSRNEIYNLMTKTTFMNAQQAVQMHFADEILFNENKAPVVANAMNPLVGGESLNKLKNLIMKEQEKSPLLEPSPQNTKNELLNQKLKILRGGN